MESSRTPAISAAAAPRVLIIDDDIELCELVTEYLRREGMVAHAVHDGESGVRQALQGAPQAAASTCAKPPELYAAVVLDVMLPGIGGFEVLRRLRAAKGPVSRLPVLMLTARGDEVDRVLGLELGADDYLPKPFSSREMVARLRAILRRARLDPVLGTEEATSGIQRPPRREVLRVDDLELDGATREVRRGGVALDLTSAEFDLLDVLLRASGEIVARDTIAKAALGRPLLPYDRSIDVHISNLRRKLGLSPRGGDRIKAVRGVGYLYGRPPED
jgi:DNA-binding response OmpR family regulator